jgi:DNA helicase-2/ATP-dependent DNA helicase PcrA
MAKARIYEGYVAALAENNAVDFDDLLTKTVDALKKDANLLAHLQARFEHVLIDEYQDTSPVQLQIARLLAAPQNNLFVVGDPDQSIYAFRKADIRNILDFEEHYPGAKVVRLEHNFRSVKNVLRCADALIAHNKSRRSKKLLSDRPTVEGPRDLVVDGARGGPRRRGPDPSPRTDAARRTATWRSSTASTRRAARSRRDCVRAASRT